MITRTITAYVSTGIALALIDSVWLMTMAPRLYQPEIGEMLIKGFRPGPAIIFYALYIVGILIFAVQPALAGGKWPAALLKGALFGFFFAASASHSINFSFDFYLYPEYPFVLESGLFYQFILW